MSISTIAVYDWHPTPELRWVNHYEDGPVYRILQQKWQKIQPMMEGTKIEEEWRDVPSMKETI